MVLLRSPRSTREGPTKQGPGRYPIFPSLLAAIDRAATLNELVTLRATGCERFRGDDRRSLIDARVAQRVLGLLSQPGA